ncbi:hypothetical protein Bbelb_304020 [Branchiostoma belcheri]|nr:hypothetical protein Bbelb_304020 [Branchiostoma belcheri]
MYQTVVAVKTAKLAQDHPKCSGGSGSFWTSIKSYLRWHLSWSHDPCEQYHQALLVDPIWEVNPLMVDDFCCQRQVLASFWQYLVRQIAGNIIRRKKKKLTERLSAWKEEQKKEKQPSQQDDKQAEIESVQEVESGVQEPAEMLMEVETVYRSWFDGGLTMCQYLNRRDERGKRPGDLGAWASQETIPLKNALEWGKTDFFSFFNIASIFVMLYFPSYCHV